MAGEWLTLLAMRLCLGSPFVGLAYGIFGSIWLASVLAALSQAPAERALAVAAFILIVVPTFVLRSPRPMGPPMPWMYAVAFAGHVAVLRHQCVRAGGLVAHTP